MYEVNYKNIKKGIFFGLPFLLVGLLFFVIIAWLTFGGMIKKMSMDSQIEATSINENCHNDDEGSYMCSPIYTFIVGGTEYTCGISYSSSNRVNSNQSTVYYDSSNPSDCVTDYTVKPSFFMYLLCLFPLIFVFVGVKQIFDVQKTIKKINYLTKYGTLIQGLKYEMEPTGMSINNVQIMAPAIDYTLPSGSIIHLKANPRYDRKSFDEDGLVDLLIDLNDPSNYYIDFNITRKL